MRLTTRKKFDAYCARIAEINGTTSTNHTFAVEPSVEQRLEDKIQENSDFLKHINIIPVDEQTSEVLGLGPTGPAAGRTDTTKADRETRDLHNMTGRTYTCRKTDFDTHVRYQTMDAWAKFKDFQARLQRMVTGQIARDRLMIGWNGTSCAADTDLVTNPLLQDVNIGWLQGLRNEAPENIITAPKVGPDAAADYRNFDSLVEDAIGTNLAPWYQEDSGLVAICGSTILNEKYLGMMDSAAADPATEQAALKAMWANKTFGTRKAMKVPFFIPNGILITRLDNLSIYLQSGSRRRRIVDNPKRDRIEDYQSVNESYVIEDLECCTFIEGILQPDGAGGWA